MQRASDF